MVTIGLLSLFSCPGILPSRRGWGEGGAGHQRYAGHDGLPHGYDRKLAALGENPASW